MLARCVVALSFLALACAGAARAQTADYRLGPQDQLKIRVFDLRSGTGETYQWTAYDDDFTVSSAGRLSLPLLGDLDVAGKTTSELAAAISAGLQSKVGLAMRPDASVQVTRYRPFYVTGPVEKPGEYEFRPGLTVLQALSLAGGMERAGDEAMLGFMRDAVNSRGDLRVLFADRDALLARQARLDAEIKGADRIVLPPEIEARSADPDVGRLIREEQLLFEARRMDVAAEAEAFQRAKTLTQNEIVSLDAKDVSLGNQLDAIKKELAQITGLVSKGLTILPRQLELQQTTAQFESNRIDLSIAKLRAQQDLSKSQKDLEQFRNTRRNEALQEATEVHTKLAETQERIVTAQRLVAHAESRAPALLTANGDTRATPDFVISRRVNGVMEDLHLKGNDAVEPGDVVTVTPVRSPSPAMALAGGDAPASKVASPF